MGGEEEVPGDQWKGIGAVEDRTAKTPSAPSLKKVGSHGDSAMMIEPRRRRGRGESAEERQGDGTLGARAAGPQKHLTVLLP